MTIRAGERVRQIVTVTPSGAPPPAVSDEGPIRIELGKVGGPVPPVGLGVASHGGGLSAREADLLRALRLDHLRVDLRLADPDWPAELARAVDAAGALGCGLELALHLTDDAETQLAHLAERLDGGIRVDRVLVFHAREQATDPRWVALARPRLGDAAPDALFAGGTNANFCELNRFRPGGAADGIVYAITPQVHAFDELSLTENLAGQPETVRTAQAFGGGRPVVVSPITLKPRFNSAASGPEAERAADELPSPVDARQMSLFGAGWTIGSLKRLIECGVSALTYYETTGWRGVVAGDAGSPLPQRFPARSGMVFPLYHVFADVAEWKDSEVVASRSSDPLAVETLAVAHAGRVHLLLANLTPESHEATIARIADGAVSLRRLNCEVAEQAALDPTAYRSRLETVVADGGLAVDLAPFEIVRLDVPAETDRRSGN
jgi:hypothetical protein